MAKNEKPLREQALEIYLKHNGNITNRAIAKMLGANEKTVSVWKYRYKWKEKLKCSSDQNNKTTTQEISLREKQKKRITEALKIANSYSPALDILIDLYLDAYEEYEKAKKENLETESLRKELARLLRDLGLDSNNKNMMQKEKKTEIHNQQQTNKLLQFRQRMTK